ncbi:MAG TPA: thiamine phosphate synthase [Candidatus Binatia bacterium]|jgi:thiamine-phosphate pyrophosphorylase
MANGRHLPPLYAILDIGLCKGREPVPILEEFLRAGVQLVQLRAKDCGSNAFLALAEAARESTRRAGAKLIVNDRIDIALAVRADGVHLGQEDLPLAAARKIAGDRLIVGVSTHSLDQARRAETDGADYIGFGPIFTTTTKATGHSPRGLAMLREIKNALSIPVVAIGGISEKNVASVWQAGGDSAAIISDLMGADDARRKIQTILALASKEAV